MAVSVTFRRARPGKNGSVGVCTISLSSEQGEKPGETARKGAEQHSEAIVAVLLSVIAE